MGQAGNLLFGAAARTRFPAQGRKNPAALGARAAGFLTKQRIRRSDYLV